MAGAQTTFKIDSYGASSIDAYLEYKRIVGDDDGGVLFTPEQYKAYKKKVIPLRMKNRLFVSWASNNGIECKMVGPETMCFCRHRYRQHKTDLEKIPETRPIHVKCGIKGCGCKSFEYVPLNGSRTIKCKCKHFADDHAEKAPHKCKVECGCKAFHSSYTCGCGQPTYAHSMIIETKEERAERGRPIGNAVPYQAMGGLTGFSLLADGYMRLDDSGIGRPPKEFLDRPIGADDHPFLRIHQGIEKLALEGKTPVASTLVRKQTTEEEDMAFFEKRYQERLQHEKEKARERAQKVAASRREQARADRARAERARTDKATAERATADRATADRARTDRARTDSATADRATADRARTDRATADRARTDRATADRARVDRAKTKAKGTVNVSKNGKK